MGLYPLMLTERPAQGSEIGGEEDILLYLSSMCG